MVFPAAGSDVGGKLVAIGCGRKFLDSLAGAVAGSPLEIITPVDPQEALKMASDDATDIVLPP